MWPRSDEEKARSRHCGFVAFVKRADAGAAKDALNETEIHGHTMRIGWGKVILRAARPSRSQPAGSLIRARLSRQAVAKPAPALTLASIQQRAAQSAAAITGGGAGFPPPGPSGPPAQAGPIVPIGQKLGHGVVHVSLAPPPEPQRALIDRLALFVVEEGPQFEQVTHTPRAPRCAPPRRLRALARGHAGASPTPCRRR